MIDYLRPLLLRFSTLDKKNKNTASKLVDQLYISSTKIVKLCILLSAKKFDFFIEEKMAKRFADTAKHKDPWWKSLPTNHKILFDFMCLDCDCAGFWKVNFDTFELLYKIKMTQDDMGVFGKKVIRIDEETYFMTSFIKVQYTKLNFNNNAHRGVLNLLNYYNIETSPYVAPAKGLDSPMLGPQDMDMEKDMEKEKGINTSTAKTISQEELIVLFNSVCAKDKVKIYASYDLPHEAKINFLNRSGKTAWRTIENWREFFEIVSASDFLTGRNNKFLATLPWLLKPDNFENVIGGMHDNRLGDKNASKAQQNDFNSKSDELFEKVLRVGKIYPEKWKLEFTDFERRVIEKFGGSGSIWSATDFSREDVKKNLRKAYSEAMGESA